MKRLGALLLLSVVSFASAVADEGHHHEEVTAEQLGAVHFPVSCEQSVQKSFERGVALLHSFWYEEAEKQFQQVAQADPHCAMAHWGVAMSLWHQLWNKPDEATIKRGRTEVKAAQKQRPSTARERDYIAAATAFYKPSGKSDFAARVMAYSTAMEQIYQRYPDDLEGAAFYALSVLATDEWGEGAQEARKKAAAVLEKLFAVEPNHPGVAHYLIHTYDTPQMAHLGLPAARRYAQLAPAAPHALHMPSHIFARLGLWQDDIDSNLASVAATRRTAAMHMGGEGHQFHALDYLVYAYLQIGRESEAQKIIEEVKAMPPMKDMYGEGSDPRIYALVVFPARYDIELRHWEDAASLQLVPVATPGDNSVTLWARVIGAARSGHPAQARNDIAEMERMRKLLLDQKKKGIADAVEQDIQEATAWTAHAEGKDDEAIQTLRTIAEKQESGAAEANGDLPAREMLADLLMDLKRPQEALSEYKTDLKFNPNRFNGLYGAARAAELAGANDEVSSYYSQLLKICEGSNSQRPELAHARQLVAKN